MKKDVSIIVPLYKGKKYINHVIEQVKENINVLEQNKKDVQVELIFVNDFPEENIEYLEWEVFPISIIRNEQNEGVHKSRITGYKASQGKYIVFFDQDDLMEKDYLLSQLDTIGKSDVVICNGFYRNGKKIFEKEPKMDSEWLYNNFKLIRSPGQVMLLRSAIPQYWTENIIISSGADDMFLWSLLAIEKRQIVYNPSDLYTHVEDGTNTSFNWEKQRKSLEEVKAKISTYYPADKFLKWEAYINESIIKFSEYAEIEKQWTRLEQENITEYLKKNNIKSLAIYGYGVIGKKFYAELQKMNIKVDYICDKSDMPTDEKVRLISKISECEPVDLMIITPMFAYKEICEELKIAVIKKVISINELLEKLG